jgi:hypothetical protein
MTVREPTLAAEFMKVSEGAFEGFATLEIHTADADTPRVAATLNETIRLINAQEKIKPFGEDPAPLQTRATNNLVVFNEGYQDAYDRIAQELIDGITASGIGISKVVFYGWEPSSVKDLTESIGLNVVKDEISKKKKAKVLAL